MIREERGGDATPRSGRRSSPGSLAALVVPGIPPVNGIVAAFLIYACLVRLT
ncbi:MULTISPECIES: hypothetical protein [unclassified Methanoculleus]|uniref:hypothetical protein n=1 Tax=unclassified Methanoculleus TaxID=2619537 RepID=UPI0025FFA6FE|nr:MULTISPECIES: hypothetical protein [unclassified Methanoculleus]